MSILNKITKQSDPDYFDRLIDEREAASFLGYSERALQNWRVRGGGPDFVKISGRSIRYRRREMIAWIEGRNQPSGANVGSPPLTRPSSEGCRRSLFDPACVKTRETAFRAQQ